MPALPPNTGGLTGVIVQLPAEFEGKTVSVSTNVREVRLYHEGENSNWAVREFYCQGEQRKDNKIVVRGSLNFVSVLEDKIAYANENLVISYTVIA